MKKLLILSLLTISLPLLCTKSKSQKVLKSYAAAIIEAESQNNDTREHADKIVPALLKKAVGQSITLTKLTKSMKNGPFICTKCRAVFQKGEPQQARVCDCCQSLLRPLSSDDTTFVILNESADKNTNIKQVKLKHEIEMLKRRSTLTQQHANALAQRSAQNTTLQQKQVAQLALLKAQLINPQPAQPANTSTATTWSLNPLNWFISSSASAVATTTTPTPEKAPMKQRTYYNGDRSVALIQPPTTNEKK